MFFKKKKIHLTNTSLNKNENLIYQTDIEKLFFFYKINKIIILEKKKEIIKDIIQEILLKKNIKEINYKNFNVELFGVDFLISDKGKLFLLEINSNPDINISSKNKFKVYLNVYQKLIQRMKNNHEIFYDNL